MAEEQQYAGTDYTNDQQYEYQEGNYPEQYQEGAGGDAATNGQYGEETPSTENQLEATNGSKKGSDDDRKLFIGGISWETEPKDLKEYFSKYGEVVDYNIKTDPTSGKCRGFGFLTFATVEAVDGVLANMPHVIKGKQIDPKRARARPGIKKIFVGGLDAELTEEDIRTHFEKYGKIDSIEQPFDKVRNQKRQFCFVTYETEEMVEEACKLAKQKIGSKECDVKRASARPDSRGGRGGAARGGARGRGGRGGYGGNQGWGQNYYGQGGYGYGQGYGYGNYGYDYTGYNGGYGSGYGNYDYTGTNWNYGAQGYGYNQQPSSYGKSRRGGAVSGGAYHPYGR